MGLSYTALHHRLRSTPSQDPRDAVFRRHRYLRHGSLLLLGVVAPPVQARRWGRELVEQLARLGLPEQRPPRLRCSSRPLLFRGFRLRCPGQRSRSPSRRPIAAGGVRPRGSPRLSLKLPASLLFRRLGAGGLLRWGGEGLHPEDRALGRQPHCWQSRVQPALLRHSSGQLLQLFGRALAATAFYYRGVDNPRTLLRLLRRLRGTLLRTLALRHRRNPQTLEESWWELERPVLDRGSRRRRRGALPPLPPLPTRELLASSRPVGEHGRRWQDSRMGLSLAPLEELLSPRPRPRRRRAAAGGATDGADGQPGLPGSPPLARLRRLPRGEPPRSDLRYPPQRS